MKTLTRIIGTGVLLAGTGGIMDYVLLNNTELRLRESNPELVQECTFIDTFEWQAQYGKFAGETIEDKLQYLLLASQVYKQLTSNPGVVQECKFLNDNKSEDFQTKGMLGGICGLLFCAGLYGIWREPLLAYRKENNPPEQDCGRENSPS